MWWNFLITCAEIFPVRRRAWELSTAGDNPNIASPEDIPWSSPIKCWAIMILTVHLHSRAYHMLIRCKLTLKIMFLLVYIFLHNICFTYWPIHKGKSSLYSHHVLHCIVKVTECLNENINVILIFIVTIFFNISRFLH